MAELIEARELRAGDVMMDPNGNLDVRQVGHYGGNGGALYVVVFVRGDSGREDPFTARWEFDGSDLVRIVTRSDSGIGA